MHTAAPWHYVEEHGPPFGPPWPGKYLIYGEDDEIVVAQTWNPEDEAQTQEQANARLMAAAPDLLRVCEALLVWERDGTPSGMNDALDLAHDAIAKAKGEAQS